MFCSEISSASGSNLFAVACPKTYARRWNPSAGLQQLHIASADGRKPKSSAISDSLRLLEWDKVCDMVSSFACTPLGREAAKAQLWATTDLSFEESKKRLEETSAAIELLNYGAGGVDFAGIDVMTVKSAIDQASRGFHMDGLEAMAVVSLIEFAGNLKTMVEAAVNDDTDCYNRFMPLAQMIMNTHICNALVKMVRQVIDEDGTVKDNASSELKQHRDQVHSLERKLYHLMDKLARNDRIETSSMEICNINGRWCLKAASSELGKLDGLLLPSGSGHLSLFEPVAAVPLNDELQQARALVAKAEEDVLSLLTDKMRAELGSIQNLLEMMIQLDVVVARARYSIEYGATYPKIFWPGVIKSHNVEGNSLLKRTSNKASLSHHLNEWKLYMRKAFHPLLLKRYRENLQSARKALAGAIYEAKNKRLQGKNIAAESIELLKERVWQLERDPPMPVDFVISIKTSIVVITGPNTGGKTISLKTVGLASLMSKSGLYVLAAEPVKVPWFDAVYADIGDEQSLTHSLSTFSGHLRQISAIHSSSTGDSLVLLDEVGAGTNPLEGTALGMSILESFAEMGAFLSMATTHHGELKTLKYSNHAFENACVEFDEESLKPTYRILWGIPGSFECHKYIREVRTSPSYIVLC
ncbi:DNA mismatch repair protein MSH1, mitochondrial [Apostasia shenzhenica]|uniref:DNA mismatch repair protein MSH1, mitochondrial n=1 Tax=Apostasia shenzhenica TaxID=1088818 RepID=A0A2I0B8V2_9ASPA|nr:DNA mismatch repair protein MSH1, mitochondrial [Apostasia shenzhenica]